MQVLIVRYGGKERQWLAVTVCRFTYRSCEKGDVRRSDSSSEGVFEGDRLG